MEIIYLRHLQLQLRTLLRCEEIGEAFVQRRKHGCGREWHRRLRQHSDIGVFAFPTRACACTKRQCQ